ncbi:hypothetical protein [Candidatus Leptofilum sp.]|uniref:hypothetical protein n=1 Tax=Candidatus Leptofilum sp. TaxID=3241576 RepID=UPI003B5BC608
MTRLEELLPLLAQLVEVDGEIKTLADLAAVDGRLPSEVSRIACQLELFSGATILSVSRIAVDYAQRSSRNDGEEARQCWFMAKE